MIPTKEIHQAHKQKNQLYWLFAATAFLLLLCWHNSSYADSLTANVDRTTIGENETLTLNVKYHGDRINSDPDFSGLTQHFDILNNQKAMQHSVVNGQINSSTEWTLTLVPKRTGQLLIPPFSLQGTRSRPINITVNTASVDPTSGHQDVFIETSTSQDEGYVQEQYIVTYALYYNRRVDDLDMPSLEIKDARVEVLPRVDYQKTLGNATYGVSEFRYAVFPDSSGTINIPEHTWTVRTTDQPSMSRFGFGGGRYKLHRAKTEAVNWVVHPKPDNYPTSAYWLPAQELKIEQSWSRNIAEFKVGEPITRTVTLTAIGASGEQLPEVFDPQTISGFKFYPDKPKQDSELNAQGVVGTRTESVAIVPTQAGELTLPEVSVTWWNSISNEIEHATLPAVAVNVIAGDNQANNIQQNTTSETAVLPSTPSVSTSPQIIERTPMFWPIISALLLLGNLAFALLWLRQRRTPHVKQDTSPPQRNRPLDKIEAACKQRQAPQLHAAIMRWVRTRFPNEPSTFDTLLRHANSKDLTRHLQTLDAHLYKDPNTPIDYDALLQAVKSVEHSFNKRGQTNPSLPELYPTY